MKKQHLITLIISLFISVIVFAQLNEKKRANYWHFGNNAGINFACIPASFPGSQLVSLEGSASISDINGNLLFYTNGETVWDRNNNIMPNGTGLLGDVSTVQSAVIIPHPGDTNRYYIFTAGTSIEDQGVIGVRFSEVDMTLNAGNGEVLASNKNTFLFAPNEEKLTAVINSTNNGYWVAAQEKSLNNWYVYQVTAAGVNMTPVISTTGPNARVDNSLGAKFSPDGKMLVSQNVCGVGPSSNANLTLYSFNDATGQLNYLWSDCGTPGFKLEFSPDCTKLYAAGSQLYQYDLTAGININDSVAIIASKTQLTSTSWTVDALQLANNCKIYVAEGGTAIGEIINPNAAGVACNYTPGSFTLTSGTTGLRFPNFVQSFFNAPCDNLNFALSATDASCINDGTASVINLTGTPQFQFLWSNGDTTQNISNLAGGMYSVTVSDGSGCTVTDSIFVNQPKTTNIDNSIITNLTGCTSGDGAIDITTSIAGFGSLDTLLAEGFETDGHGVRYTANPYPGTPSTSYFFKRGDDPNINFSVNPTLEEGTFYFGARRTGFSSLQTICDVTINPINIAGYNNLQMCALLALGANNMSTDAATRITLEYNIDNLGWNTLMDFRKAANNPFPVNGLSEDTDNNGIGDGVALTTAFQDFCYPIPGTGNSIQLRVTTNASGSSTRQTAFDYVRLKAAPPYTYTYLWSTGDTTQDVSNLAAGTYWVQITGSSGCIVTDTFTVTAPCPSSLVASFITSSTTICEGDSITFTDNSTGTNISAWNWTFNGGNPPSANTQGPHTVGFNTFGNYNIVLQITDSSGTDDTTIAITVLPRTFSTANANICQGDSILLGGSYQTNAGNYLDTLVNANGCDSIITTTLTINPSEDATFNYAATSYCLTEPNQTPTITGTPGGAFTSSPAGLSINPSTGIINLGASTPGTYGVLYTTPSLSCQDTLTVFITINPAEDATFNYTATSYCLTEPNQTPTITGTAGGTFTSNPASLSINPTTGVINVGASTPGTYGILYTTPGPSCQDTLTVFVTITTSEDATFSYSPTTFCQNNPNPSPTITGTVGGSFTSSPAGLSINPSTGIINLGASTPGTYGVLYTTPSLSCQDTLTVFITINPADDATFNYAASSYCISDPNPIAVVTGTIGGTFTINNSGVINASTGEINISGSGVGSFSITYITNGTCPDTLTLAITISNAQDATISAAGPFCSGDNAVNLGAANAGGLWSGTGITNTTTGTFNPATAGAGTHQIIYTIAGNCGDADTINILVSDGPVATLNTIDDNCYNEEGSITSIVTGGTPLYNYTWSNGFNTPDISNLASGTYTLTVTDSAGCSYTKIAIINDNTIDCDYHIFLPNIFSPNGDGNNDLFIVRGKGIESVNLVVYNRWGEKVFETSDKDIGWNGDFKGEKLNSAVFVYYLNVTMINGEKINKQGNVTLVK